MIRLTNTTTDLISLVTAQNGAKVVVAYSDATSTNYLGGNQVTSITSATTTTICATPASSTVRDVDFINIKNTYAGSHTMSVQLSVSATLYVLVTATLLTDESLSYVHGTGWCALDASGNRKEATSSSFVNINVSGTITGGAATFPGGLTLTSVAGSSYIVDSYTGTLTGCTTSPTYTIRYTLIGNQVTINIPDWTATSNTNAKTITGMPAALYPARIQYFLCATSDNGASYVASQFSVTTAGVLRFTATAGGNTWTSSGTAGSVAGAFTYTLA